MTGPAPGIQTQHLLALTQRQPLFHFAAGLSHSVYLWKRNGFDWQLTSTLILCMQVFKRGSTLFPLTVDLRLLKAIKTVNSRRRVNTDRLRTFLFPEHES